MHNAKISIIIPIYNTANYLEKCLDSVINQTYKNLQIVLVNDGSTDSSGEICDRYAAMDKRVNVIHQENAGVAMARNAGLAEATGDYIGWVDSDDWLELDMYECMLENAQQYNADVVVCSRLEQYKGESVFRGWQQTELLNKTQALQILLQDNIMQNYLWDKLWRRSLFNDIRFPNIKAFEDMAVMYKLFMGADIIVGLPYAGYNYLQRKGSLTDDISLNNRLNYFIVVKNRYDELKEVYPEFRKFLLEQCLVAAVEIWSVYYANPFNERSLAKYKIQEIANFCRQYYQEVLPCERLGQAGKLVLRLTSYAKWWAFALARFIAFLYKLRTGHNL